MKRKKKRSKDKHENAFLSEVKKILMGRYQVIDGIIIAQDERSVTSFLSYSGVMTASGKVGVFGVKSTSVFYAGDSRDVDVYNGFIRMLLRNGKTAAFMSDPDALGFINRNSLTNPVLYVLYETLDGVRLDLYTAKAASASMILLRAIKGIESELPDDVHRVGAVDLDDSDDDE